MLRAHGVTQQSCIVAVSGGVDSMSLLHCCIAIASTLQIDLHVVHVNYGLRAAESDADEELVRQVCAHHGLHCHVAQARPHDDAMISDVGLEATARALRYREFIAYAEQHAIGVVLTGHTLDDHSETVMMHLARGSGLAGIAGIPVRRALSTTVDVVRPFRHLQRSDILSYATTYGVRWRDDASNATDAFQRNRVRHHVIPALRDVFGGHVLHAIDRSSDHVRQLSHYIDDVVAIALTDIIEHHHTTSIVDLAKLARHHESLIPEILRQGLSLSYDDVQRVVQLLVAEVGSLATIHGRRRVVRERGSLILMPEDQPAPLPELGIDGDGQYVAGSHVMHIAHAPTNDVVPQGDQTVAYLDAASINGRLVWRPWKHGDRFQPLGMTGHVLVSDLLSNARVPHLQRNDVRVVCDDDGILWVCGHRQSERTRVTASTRTVCVLHYELLPPP